MNNIKKNYAILLIVISGLAILYMLKGFYNAIFFAIILAFITEPIYKKINEKIKNNTFSGILIILISFILIIVPLIIIGNVIFNQINSFTPDSSTFKIYETNLNKLLKSDISLSQEFEKLIILIKNSLKEFLPKIISFTSNFFLMSFISFFLMFYILTEKDNFIKNVMFLLPFRNKNSKELLKESGKVTKAILIGQVLTAIIQGLLGMISFLIVGIEGAIFWGIIMIILSIIPVIGAFLIWVPAGVLLILEGNVFGGVFILVWGFLVISQIDNIIRPKLVNKFAKIHPVETFIGVIIGISTFGIIGLVLGPLIISLFNTLIKVYKKEYKSQDENN